MTDNNLTNINFNDKIAHVRAIIKANEINLPDKIDKGDFNTYIFLNKYVEKSEDLEKSLKFEEENFIPLDLKTQIKMVVEEREKVRQNRLKISGKNGLISKFKEETYNDFVFAVQSGLDAKVLDKSIIYNTYFDESNIRNFINAYTKGVQIININMYHDGAIQELFISFTKLNDRFNQLAKAYPEFRDIILNNIDENDFTISELIDKEKKRQAFFKANLEESRAKLEASKANLVESKATIEPALAPAPVLTVATIPLANTLQEKQVEEYYYTVQINSTLILTYKSSLPLNGGDMVMVNVRSQAVRARIDNRVDKPNYPCKPIIDWWDFENRRLVNLEEI